MKAKTFRAQDPELVVANIFNNDYPKDLGVKFIMCTESVRVVYKQTFPDYTVLTVDDVEAEILLNLVRAQWARAKKERYEGYLWKEADYKAAVNWLKGD